MVNLISPVSKQLKSSVPTHFAIVLIIGLAALGACIVASLAFGSRVIGIKDMMDGLFNPGADSFGASVMHQRVARTVFSLCCGGALGIAGSLMQAVTRNPIADPSVLGVNTGAALFVVSGIAFFHISTANQYIALACAGAAITAVFVFGIGSLGRGGPTPIKLVLAGAATSAALSSLISAIMIPRTEVMDRFRYWQMGSVGSANWHDITTFLPFLIIGILIAIASAAALNALALGDEAASGLGVRTGVLRLIASIAGVLLCGTVTALAGPIGFIGLLATHVIRLLIGPDQRYLIPMSALAGAIILTISDVVGRVLGSPGELEVGMVTAFVGAPILILLAIRSKVRSL
ncbi:FecCD family ABC transporter permease [Paenibacillus lignilyticus]|uniref:Iron ABC transporter permease n=1 Tax=Paenibacillus lignilyticus TaxID=1172615 RepID=A0ABS5CMR6_9BACL|nr:iron ABC transporter permease [Paenibacillus lignilyticus]MBP3967157.1 iron ABC transporter permease [Paenibacillus lignilyticus]